MAKKRIHQIAKELDIASADILFHAKRGIQELNYDALKEIKALELKVYDDLKFVLPPDFVNWVKLSLFKDNVIRDLVENIQVQSATSFAQTDAAVDGC